MEFRLKFNRVVIRLTIDLFFIDVTYAIENKKKEIQFFY